MIRHRLTDPARRLWNSGIHAFVSDKEVKEVLPKLNDLHPKGRNGKALDVTSAILFWEVCSQSLRCLAQPCYRQSLADGAVRGELRVAVRCAGQSVVATGQRNWWAHRLNGHRTCVARTFTHGMVEHGLGGWFGHCRNGSTAGDASASGRGPPGGAV